MSASEPDRIEAQFILDAADEVFQIVRALPYPPHAVNAMAIAHVKLCIEGEAKSAEVVKEMMDAVTDAVVANWKKQRAQG